MAFKVPFVQRGSLAREKGWIIFEMAMISYASIHGLGQLQQKDSVSVTKFSNTIIEILGFGEVVK
jgi:hypothetical protein